MNILMTTNLLLLNRYLGDLQSSIKRFKKLDQSYSRKVAKMRSKKQMCSRKDGEPSNRSAPEDASRFALEN